ncbi:MAG: monovalent cation/H+ antiporter subunit D [Burkholderiales bacterium]|nr:monovalent cation/H+ antiporter subunit D [Burkholderiales bacterium]
MNHMVILPVVLPALAAALMLALGKTRPAVQRAVGLACTALLFAVAATLLAQAPSDMPQVYALGNWPAPFGIVMVADRLSALLVALTALVALAALAYAAQGWDNRGRHFHALFQFQLMGINGAFLTGDLFNLFVFFEVMLIASYGLLLHGLGAPRLRAALHYVVINLAASAVFLIAVSLLYGVTGTLNMAHLAERVAQVPPADVALVRAAGLMLLGVFAVKAALFPLYFWLPAAYSSACAPVAALFSIMTKVGVYAIIRVTTLIFGGDTGAAELTSPWLLPAALATLVLAALGALGAERFTGLIAYLTVASVGTMLAAVAAGGAAALSGALFYLVHSTLVIAALFLLAELLGRQRGIAADTLRAGPALLQPALLGLVFLLGAASVAGVPPSSGFLGKLMILKGTQDATAVAWIWSILLGASLITLVGCARAGSILLWNIAAPQPAADAAPARPGEWLPLATLLAGAVLMVVFAAPLKRYADATAAELLSRTAYIAAVLGPGQDRAPRALGKGGGT